MRTDTHTPVGHLASARVAPVGAVTSSLYGSLGQRHQSSIWTAAALAPTTSFMVCTGKNRTPRPLSERSP